MIAIGRPSAGDFDPVEAIVLRPERDSLPSGEPMADRMVPFLETRIKSPRALYTSERENQGHPQSTSDLVIEVRNEGGGDDLTADMQISHRKRTYQIKGILRSDFRKGTTCYQVTQMNDFRI